MRIPLGTRYYKDRSLPSSTVNLVNLFVETKAQDTKSLAIIRKSPGLPTYRNIGDGGIRGMYEMGGLAYVVSGTTLSDIQGNSLGTIPGTGRVGMASNDRQTGAQLVIVNGTTTAYVYTTAGLTTTTLTGPAHTVVYQDGYFIYDYSGTGNWFISPVQDGTTYDALETGATNARPDNVLSIVSNHQQIWVFGTKTIEIFYNSGTLDFPFTRINEATNDEIGLGARWSLAEMDNTIYWVGSDREVYRAEGYNAKQISDPTVSELLRNANLETITAFSYSKDGHKFYQLNMDDVSVVFDARENAWHQRGFFKNGVYERARGDTYIWWNGKHLVGDHENGNIYEMDNNVHTDAMGAYLRWEMVLPPVHNDGERLAIRRLELDIEHGVGLTSGQGSDPQVMFSISEDARIWGPERQIPFGRIGKYKYKSLIHRLGSTDNQFIYRYSGSDAVSTTIMNCYVQI